MLSVKQAESIILDLVQPKVEQELVDLEIANQRVLAASISKGVDFPHCDNSAMDGYAVQFDDIANCSSENPVLLEVIEEIPAGYQPQRGIETGQAARIFTGGCLPAGADTIVMQEDTRKERGHVAILAAGKKENFIRKKGSFYRSGSPLLQAGITLNAAEIGILAATQCLQVLVYRRPKVAIFSTGDELVRPDTKLLPGQLVDSNQYALSVAIAQMGIEVIKHGIVKDNKKELQEAIEQASFSADVIISTGGVSVGDYDYVEAVLDDLGAEIHIKSVAIKPGKPLTFATFDRIGNQPKYYFGLPGNPVSALVCFWRFVVPALGKLSGKNESEWKPVFVEARTTQDLHSDGKRETYLWGQLSWDNDGIAQFDLASGSQNSANLINLALTTGLAVLPLGTKMISAGALVAVLKL